MIASKPVYKQQFRYWILPERMPGKTEGHFNALLADNFFHIQIGPRQVAYPYAGGGNGKNRGSCSQVLLGLVIGIP
ncbi:MAG: hypothetical protein V2B15_11585 [Bacteroidota bacterium]